MNKILIYQIVSVGVLATFASAQAVKPAQNNEKIGIINHALASDDTAQLDIACRGIGELLDNRQIPSTVVKYWLPDLMGKHRYEDAASLALKVANLVPDSKTIDAMMILRVQAFGALGRPKDALEAAKIAFNVCPIENTQRAITSLSTWMGKANPEDAGIGRRFNMALIATNSPPAEVNAANASQPADTLTGASYLKSIKIDASVFAKELERLKASKTTLGDEINYGNLLLASDQTAEAESVFQELYKSRTAPREKTQIAEAIGRAYRAEDGNMTRATQWLISQSAAAQPQGPAQPKAAKGKASNPKNDPTIP